MKNPTLALVTGALLFCSTSSAQLPRIVVQGSGAPQVFSDFTEAVSAAQANDVLYLSGGSFPYTGGLVLDKPLRFIGAGIDPDSSQVTTTTTLFMTNTNAPLVLTTAASGSTFTGIRFGSSFTGTNVQTLRYGTSNSDDLPTGIVFTRCQFNGRVQLAFNSNSVAGSETTLFEECIFNLDLVGHNRAAVVSRCVFDASFVGLYAIQFFSGGSLLVENCVFLNAIMANCNGATVRNTISTSTNYICLGCNGATFSNNVVAALSVAISSSGIIEADNIVDADPSTFFVSETDGVFQYSDDLHMAPGSPGIGQGTDGTDVGIFGTNAPFKPGSVPFNPHFRAASIAPATNADGDLPVNIRVAAQSN